MAPRPQPQSASPSAQAHSALSSLCSLKIWAPSESSLAGNRVSPLPPLSRICTACVCARLALSALLFKSLRDHSRLRVPSRPRHPHLSGHRRHFDTSRRSTHCIVQRTPGTRCQARPPTLDRECPAGESVPARLGPPSGPNHPGASSPLCTRSFSTHTALDGLGTQPQCVRTVAARVLGEARGAAPASQGKPRPARHHPGPTSILALGLFSTGTSSTGTDTSVIRPRDTLGRTRTRQVCQDASEHTAGPAFEPAHGNNTIQALEWP